jgi:hypothetical protein
MRRNVHSTVRTVAGHLPSRNRVGTRLLLAGLCLGCAATLPLVLGIVPEAAGAHAWDLPSLLRQAATVGLAAMLIGILGCALDLRRGR